MHLSVHKPEKKIDQCFFNIDLVLVQLLLVNLQKGLAIIPFPPPVANLLKQSNNKVYTVDS